MKWEYFIVKTRYCPGLTLVYDVSIDSGYTNKKIAEKEAKRWVSCGEFSRQASVVRGVSVYIAKSREI